VESGSARSQTVVTANNRRFGMRGSGAVVSETAGTPRRIATLIKETSVDSSEMNANRKLYECRFGLGSTR
jgi:hypothetical protein